MTWIAQLTGNTDNLPDADAQDTEARVLDALRRIAQLVTGLGHTGVQATFTGDHSGHVDLLLPGGGAAGDYPAGDHDQVQVDGPAAATPEPGPADSPADSPAELPPPPDVQPPVEQQPEATP
jgi:hypothetical protein